VGVWFWCVSLSSNFGEKFDWELHWRLSLCLCYQWNEFWAISEISRPHWLGGTSRWRWWWGQWVCTNPWPWKGFILPVPIELWALSVIATLVLLKSFPAGNYAKDLGSFKMEATSNQPTTANRNPWTWKGKGYARERKEVFSKNLSLWCRFKATPVAG